jgi:hypothetical protein
MGNDSDSHEVPSLPKRLILFLFALSIVLSVSSVLATPTSHSGGSSHPHSSSSHVGTAKTAHVRAPHTTSPASRNSRGRIKPSAAAKDEFLHETGYPHGRKGYVVDHKVSLACGGADAPSNMQWQTTAEGKAKDKVERRGCRK